MRVDSKDFQLLNIFAENKQLTSYAVAKQFYPEETDVNRRLSSIIYRLNKLVKLGLLQRLPHPDRKDGHIYTLSPRKICLNGTIFIPSKAGGIILNCKFANECHNCTFGAPDCKLYKLMKQKKLDLALDILELAVKHADLNPETQNNLKRR